MSPSYSTYRCVKCKNNDLAFSYIYIYSFFISFSLVLNGENSDVVPCEDESSEEAISPQEGETCTPRNLR